MTPLSPFLAFTTVIFMSVRLIGDFSTGFILVNSVWIKEDGRVVSSTSLREGFGGETRLVSYSIESSRGAIKGTLSPE